MDPRRTFRPATRDLGHGTGVDWHWLWIVDVSDSLVVAREMGYRQAGLVVVRGGRIAASHEKSNTHPATRKDNRHAAPAR